MVGDKGHEGLQLSRYLQKQTFIASSIKMFSQNDSDHC